MHLQSKSVYVADHVFEVWKEIYEPAEDTFLFTENLHVGPGSRVLDMGTGCGILGILAAKNASNVLATDINRYAVHCAKENAVLNDTDDKMLFLRGDLFSPIASDAKFDIIIFNAPYLPSKNSNRASWLSRAWAGGPDGRQIIDRFLFEAPDHLKSGGEILLMQSNLSCLDETIRVLKNRRLKTQIVAERSLPFFETLFLIRASMKQSTSSEGQDKQIKARH